MTEILTKEQLKAQKDKEAVASMKAAKNNMETALSRIGTLEYCVSSLGSLIDSMLDHIPEQSYAYESRETNRVRFKNKRNEIMKHL